MEKYFAVDDRNRRLNRTVCLFDNEPVYVMCSDPAGQVLLQDDEVFIMPLDTKDSNLLNKYTKVKYTNDSFQARAFPLGYITHENGATYLARTPSQQQRQGLHADVITTDGDPLPYAWLTSKEMAACIKGEHMSFTLAVATTLLRNRAHSFDRLWAVAPLHKNTLNLLFRGRSAGSITNGVATLFEGRETRLLRTLLQEKGLKVND